MATATAHARKPKLLLCNAIHSKGQFHQRWEISV